ncbi:hypothetical protein TNCV_1257361 [Trichonephila clavipes]|nr:hypothetical protein TNCV_1257361 [Trichonephila clavipes]
MFQSSSRFLGLLVLPIYRQSKTYGPCLNNDWPGIHQINFGSMWKLLYPKDTSKAALTMPKRVAAVAANNGGYTNY